MPGPPGSPPAPAPYLAAFGSAGGVVVCFDFFALFLPDFLVSAFGASAAGFDASLRVEAINVPVAAGVDTGARSPPESAGRGRRCRCHQRDRAAVGRTADRRCHRVRRGR